MLAGMMAASAITPATASAAERVRVVVDASLLETPEGQAQVYALFREEAERACRSRLPGTAPRTSVSVCAERLVEALKDDLGDASMDMIHQEHRHH